MLVMLLLGLLLAQAPASPLVAPTAKVSEQEFGRGLVLQSSYFLEWRPVRTFVCGWDAALAEIWRLEVIPTNPTFSRVSLSVETRKFEKGIGMILPRFEVAVSGELKLAVESPVPAALSSASGAIWRSGMPRLGLLTSGRF